MTMSAWVMLGATWGCVISFTGYFFVKVVRARTPFADEREENTGRATESQRSEAD